MLNIFYKLEPFFQDNYREIHVREYARLLDITPPTASSWLEEMHEEGLLNREEKYGRILYSAKREGLFIGLSRLYWQEVFRGLIEQIEHAYIDPLVILFGSFAKAEVTERSDIDIAIFSPTKKETVLKFQDRTVQTFIFDDVNNIPNNLLINVLNGFVLAGRWNQNINIIM